MFLPSGMSNVPSKFLATSAGATVGSLEKIGLSLSIPAGALSSPTDILVHPCDDRMNLPDGYEPASPVYCIRHSDGTKFQKMVTVEMLHYIYLESPEDCKDMAFMTSRCSCDDPDSAPNFTKVEESEGHFQPESQVGKIEVSHFSHFLLAVFGNKRESRLHGF